MAQVTITIPNAVIPRVKAALRAKWDNQIYPSPDGKYMTNPLNGKTDAEAFQWMVSEWVKQQVIDYETEQARVGVNTTISDATTKASTDMSGIA